MSSPETEAEVTTEAIADTITSLVRKFDDELFALSEAELTSKWYFRWDENESVSWNIYRFSDNLERYKNRCRRWEVHHNGSSCVVERVRDKYLMPWIKSFADELKSHTS